MSFIDIMNGKLIHACSEFIKIISRYFGRNFWKLKVNLNRDFGREEEVVIRAPQAKKVSCFFGATIRFGTEVVIKSIISTVRVETHERLINQVQKFLDLAGS